VLGALDFAPLRRESLVLDHVVLFLELCRPLLLVGGLVRCQEVCFEVFQVCLLEGNLSFLATGQNLLLAAAGTFVLTDYSQRLCSHSDSTGDPLLVRCNLPRDLAAESAYQDLVGGDKKLRAQVIEAGARERTIQFDQVALNKQLWN